MCAAVPVSAWHASLNPYPNPKTPISSCVFCRSLLCNKLLLHSTLPLPSLILLVQLLGMLPPVKRESEAELAAEPVTHSIIMHITSTIAQVLVDLTVSVCVLLCILSV